MESNRGPVAYMPSSALSLSHTGSKAGLQEGDVLCVVFHILSTAKVTSGPDAINGITGKKILFIIHDTRHFEEK